MKYTQLYSQIIALVKTKREIRLFLESRNTPRDNQDTLTSQTYIFVYDSYTQTELLSASYNDNEPEEHKRITKDINHLITKLGDADKQLLKQYQKYITIYQGLINRSKGYKEMVFKLVVMQKDSHQTSFSLEGGDDPIMLYIDEDQDESYNDLVRFVNAIKTIDTFAEEDDQMNVL